MSSATGRYSPSMRAISAAWWRDSSDMSRAFATIRPNSSRWVSTRCSAASTAAFSSSTSAGELTSTRLRTATARSSTAARIARAMSARALMPLT